MQKGGSLWIVPHQFVSKAVTMAPAQPQVDVTAIPIGLAPSVILVLKDGLTSTAMKRSVLMAAPMGLVLMPR